MLTFTCLQEVQACLFRFMTRTSWLDIWQGGSGVAHRGVKDVSVLIKIDSDACTSQNLDSEESELKVATTPDHLQAIKAKACKVLIPSPHAGPFVALRVQSKRGSLGASDFRNRSRHSLQLGSESRDPNTAS